MNTPFATSQRDAITPLAHHGILVTDCFEQIRDRLAANAHFLAARGMHDAATFLAEPVHDLSGHIDWYTDLRGTPVPVTTLPAETQEAVRRHLAVCGRALNELSRRFEYRDSMTAAMIRLAMRHPSPDDIHVCGRHIVLINWGFGPGADGGAQEDIMRLGLPPVPPPPPAAAPMPPTPPAAPTPAPEPAPRPEGLPRLAPGPGCIPWLGPLLLLALLLWLVCAAAGLVSSPLPAGCFHQPVDMDNEMARGSRLDAEADALRQSLREFSAFCLPGPSEAELKQLQEAEPEEQAVPVPPQPAPEAKEPAPAPATKHPAKGSTMQIPEDAAQKQDVSFLDGCWRSDHSFQSTYGGTVTVEYCFDRRGKGERILRHPGGNVCRGAVNARFSGSSLVIDAAGATCKRGARHGGQNVTCQGSGASTFCTGEESNGNLREMTFTRR